MICIAAMTVSLTAAGERLTVMTYNVGLLRAFGSDYVAAVEARAKQAPAVIAAFAAASSPDIMLLEEIWEDGFTGAISNALAPLGYTSVTPRVRSIIGLSSGLMLFVKTPLKIIDWKFSPFTKTTFIDSFAKKGVLEADLKNTVTGTEFFIVGTHTLALDTTNGAPSDKGQLDAFTVQASDILSAVRRRSTHGKPGLLIGDFNVGPGYADSAYRLIAGTDGFIEAGSAVIPGEAFTTWDPQNPLIAYGKYPNEPPAKIDHIFLVNAGRWKAHHARTTMRDAIDGAQLTNNGRVIPLPLSDHYGFLAVITIEK